MFQLAVSDWKQREIQQLHSLFGASETHFTFGFCNIMKVLLLSGCEAVGEGEHWSVLRHCQVVHPLSVQ